MTTATQTPAIETAPFYFNKTAPVQLGGLKTGDKVRVWLDGARRPLEYTVDGIGALSQLVGMVGKRGGEAFLVQNIHNHGVRLVAGRLDKGLVAKVEIV